MRLILNKLQRTYFLVQYIDLHCQIDLTLCLLTVFLWLDLLEENQSGCARALGREAFPLDCSELSTELLVCVKRCADVIEIDTAVL